MRDGYYDCKRVLPLAPSCGDSLACKISGFESNLESMTYDGAAMASERIKASSVNVHCLSSYVFRRAIWLNEATTTHA